MKGPMRWSATRARWVLLGGAVLLAGIVAAFFGLARYRAGRVWQRILARNGVHVTRETNGFTYSQSSKGRTVFTLHASKATPQGPNKWVLHDAVLILYGRQPGHDDRIYGSEFQYDQAEGIARAMGEVHLDLQAPEPDGKAPAAGARPSLDFGTEQESADPGLIHVRTSGLVYMRKVGLAATGQPTEFRYRGLTCTSRGAEFDTEHSVIRLLADVRLSGQLRQGPFSLAAARATLDRTGNAAELLSPVLVSRDRSARASHAVFHLHRDGSLETAEAEGAVQLRSGTQSLQAPLLSASFGPGNAPQHAELRSGVFFADTDAAAPAQGSAKTLDLVWSSGNLLQQAVAGGSVALTEHAVANGVESGRRQIHAAQATASFASDGGRHALLRTMKLAGGAEVQSANYAATAQNQGPNSLRVAADELLSSFAVGEHSRPLAQTLSGQGHTVLEERAANGAREKSTGDTLEMTFASGPAKPGRGVGVAVASAMQTGRVEVESWPAPKTAAPNINAAQGDTLPTTGRAGRTVYSAADGTLRLTGAQGQSAQVRHGSDEVQGDTATLQQGTGDADVQGHVVATQAGQGDSPATHILASEGHLLRDAGLATFLGDAAHPAQLFQGGSQVQAVEITLDRAKRRLTARPGNDGGTIRATFATVGNTHPDASKGNTGNIQAGPGQSQDSSLGRPGGNGVTAAELPLAQRGIVAVSAARMDFDDVARQAVFAGNVRLNGAVGTVTAEHGVAILKPVAGASGPKAAADQALALGGSLDRVVLQGEVRLRQPGRTGEGEQMIYTAGTGNYVLTGTAAKPPRITGEQGTVITGATLLFRSAENTVVVAGAGEEGRTSGPRRVHTERDLKQ